MCWPSTCSTPSITWVGGAADGCPFAEAATWLLAAAAAYGSSASLLSHAALSLGLDEKALEQAQTVGGFPGGWAGGLAHSLLASAAYAASTVEERQQIHQALAESADQAGDPIQAAWHRGAATTTPDEDVAEDLEHAAANLGARGSDADAATNGSPAMRSMPRTRTKATLTSR